MHQLHACLTCNVVVKFLTEFLLFSGARRLGVGDVLHGMRPHTTVQKPFLQIVRTLCYNTCARGYVLAQRYRRVRPTESDGAFLRWNTRDEKTAPGMAMLDMASLSAFSVSTYQLQATRTSPALALLELRAAFPHQQNKLTD